jgi:tetratricopeptide (TPR) repeat protein
MKKITPILAIVFVCTLLFSCSKKEKAEKHFKKGVEYYFLGSYDQAIGEYRKALEIDSTLVKVYLNLGTVYFKKGDYESAILYYKKALSYNPYNVKAHYNLGIVYSLKNDKEKALEEVNYLKNIAPSIADSLKKHIY